VLLTLTTTHQPATDLGYLLVKHPDRVQSFGVTGGQAHMFYPEATVERCTAALLLDIDLHVKDTPEGFALGRYVNDRPYAASSLLSAAIAKVWRTALRGDSPDRPELARTPIPLMVDIPALRCTGGPDLAEALFGPLGWTVQAAPIPLDATRPDWGPSRYLHLTLVGTVRLSDALSQVYVLLPVLDDAKHYWVAPDEVDKLLRAGTHWLAGHPEKALIARRYLAHKRRLADEALARLSDVDAPDTVDVLETVDEDSELPAVVKRLPLAAQRRDAVLAAVESSGATRVLDLGCGPGALLGALIANRRLTEIVGVDVSTRALEMAERRLRLDRLPERQRGRIRLLQSALTYRDDRLKGYDAAVLMEVVEHIDPPRLPSFASAVFGHAAPGTVIVTTPNAEYNVRYEGLEPGRFRHHDHRFEWDRPAFAAWASTVAATYGYTVALSGVGDEDPVVGHPTQLAVFGR
jgi:3' terminal RNA ribose 2'-O-methyltransferase Hen1